MTRVKKVEKCRWWPRNGCDGRSVAIIFNYNLSDEFVCVAT